MKKHRIEYPCSWCGTIITRRPSDVRYQPRQYCSPACSRLGLSRSLSLAMKGNPVLKEVGRRNYTKLQDYYADGKHPPNYQAEGKGLICQKCDSTFDVHPHKVRDGKAKYCSLACYNATRGNPSRPVLVQLRSSPEYRRWRRAVFERDNYICQECRVLSSPGVQVYLHAHHIAEFSQHPDLRLVLENGITLCDACHYALHHRQHIPKQYLCVACGEKCSRRATRCFLCHQKYASTFPRKVKTDGNMQLLR